MTCPPRARTPTSQPEIKVSLTEPLPGYATTSHLLESAPLERPSLEAVKRMRHVIILGLHGLVASGSEPYRVPLTPRLHSKTLLQHSFRGHSEYIFSNTHCLRPIGKKSGPNQAVTIFRTPELLNVSYPGFRTFRTHRSLSPA
jgi:hypothetical protein